jgi:hypothetical protein
MPTTSSSSGSGNLRTAGKPKAPAVSILLGILAICVTTFFGLVSAHLIQSGQFDAIKNRCADDLSDLVAVLSQRVELANAAATSVVSNEDLSRSNTESTTAWNAIRADCFDPGLINASDRLGSSIDAAQSASDMALDPRTNILGEGTTMSVGASGLVDSLNWGIGAQRRVVGSDKAVWPNVYSHKDSLDATYTYGCRFERDGVRSDRTC